MLKKVLIVLTLLISCLGFRSNIVLADSIDNYEIVEYIQSSGSQYINTGITPNLATDKFNIVFDVQSSGSWDVFAGVQQSGYQFLVQKNGSNFRSICGVQNNNNYYYDNSFAHNTLYNVTLSNTGVIIDDVSHNFNSQATNQGSAAFTIFCLNNNGNRESYSKMKLYSFKYYRSDQLILDLVPVKRLSDSKYGMYDLVSDTFFGNNGSGNFSGGSVSQYIITTNISPIDAGSVSGGGTFTPNSICTLTATPNTGYIFSAWSDGNTDNPRSFTVTQSLTITAIFEAAPQQYTVTLNASPQAGGIVSGSGSYTQGSTVQIEAVTNPGYVFTGWSDGVMYAERTFIINGDVTLTAYFEEEQTEYDVVLNVYPESSGTVTGDGTYEDGSSVQIEAVPEDGYEFVQWSDGSNVNPRVITVDHSYNLTAQFQESTEPPEPTPTVDPDSIKLIAGLIVFLILVNMNKGGLI